MLWDVVQDDCLHWLSGHPDDSIDLLVTSPPYEDRRSYGGIPSRTGQEWVDWCVEWISVARRKVTGLIAINCEGQGRQNYSAVPYMLAGDLIRRGLKLRKPIVWWRDGVPGSGGAASDHAAAGGGPDGLKNSWEPVLLVDGTTDIDYEQLVLVGTGGKLPWANGNACGAPPLWTPGGDPTNYLANGKRHTKRRRQGGMEVQYYTPPVIANPGNVWRILVGGSRMGHPLAHKCEAAFPLELPRRLIVTFCKPGGTVADPFCGSGSTAHAAIISGRNFVGCDLRVEMVELTYERLLQVEAEDADHQNRGEK